MQITCKGNAVNHRWDVHRAATSSHNTWHMYYSNANIIIVQIINLYQHSSYQMRILCIMWYSIILSLYHWMELRVNNKNNKSKTRTMCLKGWKVVIYLSAKIFHQDILVTLDLKNQHRFSHKWGVITLTTSAQSDLLLSVLPFFSLCFLSFYHFCKQINTSEIEILNAVNAPSTWAIQRVTRGFK